MGLILALEKDTISQRRFKFHIRPKATTTIGNIEIYRNPCGKVHKLSNILSFLTDTERRFCKKNLKLFPIFHFYNLILFLNDRLVFNSMIEGRGGIKICQVERESAGFQDISIENAKV